MYSTGTLLIVCGVPATILMAFGLKIGPDHLDRSQALLFGAVMVFVEVVIAVILLYVAGQVSKRRDKICTKNDDADA